MNQDTEGLHSKLRVPEFFGRCRVKIDESDERKLKQISASIMYRLNNLEELSKKPNQLLWRTEQELGRIKTDAIRDVANRLSDYRICKALLHQVSAKYHDPTFLVTEVNEDQIRRRTFVEIEELWRETVDRTWSLARGF